MKKQFLFTDLDLTLLTTGKTISDEDLKAIKELLDSGSFFAFVTGR
ncbi:MAG: HAD hydrolase family protein, partial [Lachnospiraceae bacterium]|nr:HAD hydrolase family protein [Lachnospiraceae bacterium]